MECEGAKPFVSALHDGEAAPAEAVEHIKACRACRQRLRDYAEIAAELRLLASEAEESAAEPALRLSPRVRSRSWVRALKAGVLVPRFVLTLGIVAIVALSVGLGSTRAQGRGEWFQYEVSSHDGENRMGGTVGARAPNSFGMEVDAASGTPTRVWIRLEVVDIRDDLVRLSVRARRFAGNPVPSTVEEGLAAAPPQEYRYVPGQTLHIPVEGETLSLTGQVVEKPPKTEDPALQLALDEIALTDAALARDGQLIMPHAVIMTRAHGEEARVGFGVPDLGTLTFWLKPLEGAVPAQANFGRAEFTLDGHKYLLFSATPITSGKQPRQIWVSVERYDQPPNGESP